MNTKLLMSLFGELGVAIEELVFFSILNLFPMHIPRRVCINQRTFKKVSVLGRSNKFSKVCPLKS